MMWLKQNKTLDQIYDLFAVRIMVLLVLLITSAVCVASEYVYQEADKKACENPSKEASPRVFFRYERKFSSE